MEKFLKVCTLVSGIAFGALFVILVLEGQKLMLLSLVLLFVVWFFPTLRASHLSTRLDDLEDTLWRQRVGDLNKKLEKLKTIETDANPEQPAPAGAV